MLNKMDDYPIHQTPEPIAHPATSDRNVYDRTWFNGYVADGRYYFAIGMAIYPHRGILDCAFSVVEQGARQHCFFASRRAPAERTEMQVGPFTLEVLEPMRRARVIIDDNETGIAAELTFSARTAAIQEARQTMWNGPRRVLDSTRFAQFGVWNGTIRHPDGEIEVQGCHGTKDRSWGARGVGEREIVGAPVMPQGLHFVWAPLFWEDHVSHAIFFDGPLGEPLHQEGVVAPLYDDVSQLPGTEDPAIERMARAAHRIRHVKGTRLAASAEIDLVNPRGDVRTITLSPILKFQMKGLGYSHPEWGQGMWKGELAIGTESFDPAGLNMLALENIHVQQVVKASDGTREGVGVLEQAGAGPHALWGFSDFFDGAS